MIAPCCHPDVFELVGKSQQLWVDILHLLLEQNEGLSYGPLRAGVLIIPEEISHFLLTLAT